MVDSQHATAPNDRSRKQVLLIADVLYEVGAGEHLHAQQRAQYRRDVAQEILRRLSEGSR